MDLIVFITIFLPVFFGGAFLIARRFDLRRGRSVLEEGDDWDDQNPPKVLNYNYIDWLERELKVGQYDPEIMAEKLRIERAETMEAHKGLLPEPINGEPVSDWEKRRRRVVKHAERLIKQGMNGNEAMKAAMKYADAQRAADPINRPIAEPCAVDEDKRSVEYGPLTRDAILRRKFARGGVQSQSSGAGSANYQAGGDMTVRTYIDSDGNETTIRAFGSREDTQ